MAIKNNQTSDSSLLFRSILAVLVFIIVVVYFYKTFWEPSISNNPKFATFEKSLQQIRAAMNVDSVRQFNIQKIMQIIDGYNENMPSSMKYEIANEIYDMSAKFTNLEIDLICAAITHESGSTWDPEVVSESGAMGLLQILPTTGMWIAYYEGITWNSAEEVLFNPIYNIRIGCRNLSTLIEKYELEGGLAAFNGGEKKAAIWLANNKADGILWVETSNYIPQVLSLYNEYKSLTL